MEAQLKLCAALLALLLLAACGTPGAPQPPSLELPQPVDDLAATRKGDRVTLTWTPQAETTDGQAIRRPGPARICRVADEFPVTQCGTAVAELPPAAPTPSNQPPAKRNFMDTLPRSLQQQWPAAFATYAVESLNARGRSAGLSNQVRVPLAPTLPPPTDLRAEVTNDGILLNFSGAMHEHESPRLRHRYRLYRQLEGATAAAVIGEVALRAEPGARVVDRSFEWEKAYSYWVAAVTAVAAEGSNANESRVEVEGEDSPAVKVLARDVFPPAVPLAVQAVFSGVGQQPFVDLTWAPNLESDLAGYHVYRHEQGAPPQRINAELVTTPAFRDSNVTARTRYFYSVSAVDLRGNESGRSEQTSEQVP